MAKQPAQEVATAPLVEEAHQPYVPDHVQMHEFTWSAVAVGAVLGIIFGASSLYLVLKVGMTVSASIPVAVMSITLFRAFSRAFGMRKTTILENNIVQTTGSAGESIAFGVGVTLPALMMLGHEMEIVRVMTVGVLGGLLGILMMIPLRKAFIVKQHKELPYPEGTACADVLIVGEKGGASAKTVFVGFGIAFFYNISMKLLKLWQGEVTQPLHATDGQGVEQGLNKGEIGAEITPELLGVGYIIGPRIASITFAGGVLAYLVLVPAIALFGEGLTKPVFPAVSKIDAETGQDKGLIKNMSVGDLRDKYILYIGAGAVATGGIISMFQAMPLIIGSIAAGLRDLRGSRGDGSQAVPRTERDMPMSVVLVGSLVLVAALAAIPQLGLGFSPFGLLGSVLIVLLGFLFVTVSARLTGTIGSSSNPISGMTVATLLITCLVFLLLGKTDKGATLTALTVAAVVCIAASNGGTTAQDLKTGHLVGGTPKLQQIAILVGALTSAAVMGGTLLLLNESGTIYTQREEYLPKRKLTAEERNTLTTQVRHNGEQLWVLHAADNEYEGVQQGTYYVSEDGSFHTYVDPAINGRVLGKTDDGAEKRMHDNGEIVQNNFPAPKTRLMAIIIDGILNQKLPWSLVLIGVLIAVCLELAGIPALPFAVGVYLPISVSAPIFIGGMLRLLVDRLNRRRNAATTDSDSSPGVLLSSGYIAGGAIAGVCVAFLEFAPEAFRKALNFGGRWAESLKESVAADEPAPVLKFLTGNWPGIIIFSALVVFLFLVGREMLLRAPPATDGPPQRTP